MIDDVPRFSGPSKAWLDACRRALFQLDKTDLPYAGTDNIVVKAFIIRRLGQ